jgi:nucleoside-diphosphate-sugar epimerase
MNDDPIQVNVVAEPPLLREILRAHVDLADDLVFVEDLRDAHVLVISTARGPLYVAGLEDPSLVEHATGLAEAVRSKSRNRRVVTLPEAAEARHI